MKSLFFFFFFFHSHLSPFLLPLLPLHSFFFFFFFFFIEEDSDSTIGGWEQNSFNSSLEITPSRPSTPLPPPLPTGFACSLLGGEKVGKEKEMEREYEVQLHCMMILAQSVEVFFFFFFFPLFFFFFFSVPSTGIRRNSLQSFQPWSLVKNHGFYSLGHRIFLSRCLLRSSLPSFPYFGRGKVEGKGGGGRKGGKMGEVI